tara:strand:+ start:748 stop:1434 length:687 start_codon:yes stop_codon:yes gene_type:complete
MRFPTVCYDGFYKDPDSIVDFALSLDYHSDLGRYPGCRTKCLSKIDKNLYHSCMHKFLSMFDDFDEPNIGVIGQTSFQKTWRFSNKKEHPVNKGWIHKDGALLAAVVYLSKNPDPNSGTTIFKRKFGEETPPLPIVSGEVLGMEKQVDVNSIKKYERSLIENNKPFDVQMEVKNAYNRIICYDGEQDHTQTNYWMSNEDFRLTQVFFVKDIDCFAKKIPSMRCNRYGI